MGNEFAVRISRSTGFVLTIGVSVVAFALAGCGSSSKTPASNTSSAPAAATSAAGSSADSSSAAAASSASSSSSDDCGGAVGRVTSAVASFPEVTKVQTIAACGEVDIQTNLPSGVLGSPSATKGAEICDAAAAVAYQGDVSSITVSATDGHEIATGLKSAPCIPG